MFRLKMTLSFRSTGLGSTDRLALVRQLRAALESAGGVQPLLGLPGGGISAQVQYDLAGGSGVAAHRVVLEDARRAAEQVGFYVVDVAVSQLVSKAVEGTLVGAAAGLFGGSRTNNPWVVLGAGVAGALAGNLLGSDVKSELPYLLGATDEYGRWWLQAAHPAIPGITESVGQG